MRLCGVTLVKNKQKTCEEKKKNMSTDNKPAASGSGKLVLGIAIGCGCSLLMALLLIVVGAVMLFEIRSHAVQNRGMLVPTSSECVPLFPPHIVPATSANESHYPSIQSPFQSSSPTTEYLSNSPTFVPPASISIEPVKPDLPITVVEVKENDSVAEPVE
jgi:hypothetical protein